MTTEQSFSIGGVRIDGSFGVAPMAGVGDRAFRTICRRHGAAYSVSEMVSAKALCYGDKKTEQLLSLDVSEQPGAVQIFGSEPEFMARGAQIALKMSGAAILDLNMGCPAGKIIRSGEGSALMKSPETAEACIRAVVEAVEVPVTVKFRAGWDETSRNAVEFAQMAAAAGAAALCVHGRTRAQMYAGKADRTLMKAVVEAVDIPVMVNGDVTDGASGRALLEETGAKFALIGRGCLGNPWVFEDCHAAMRGEAYTYPDLANRLQTACEQARLAAEQKGEGTACRELRAHMMYYLRGIRSAASYRVRATQVKTIAELETLVAEILAAAE